MQNANDFAQTTANIPALSNHDVKLNDAFCVAVALQFLAERFPNSPITLVSTVNAGYNDYQILNIPAEHLDHFIGHSGFDEFDDTENNFITIDNDVYALYTDFAELSYNLETQIDVDTFK
jgi:hypothetical protein